MALPEHEFDDGLLERGFRFIPQKEQNYIAEYARLIGISDYDYSRQEYTRLRKLAKKARVDKKLILTLDRAYCFTHFFARRIRTGAHNSTTGMCWHGAIGQYAHVAKVVECKASVL